MRNLTIRFDKPNVMYDFVDYLIDRKIFDNFVSDFNIRQADRHNDLWLDVSYVKQLEMFIVSSFNDPIEENGLVEDVSGFTDLDDLDEEGDDPEDDIPPSPGLVIRRKDGSKSIQLTPEQKDQLINSVLKASSGNNTKLDQ